MAGQGNWVTDRLAECGETSLQHAAWRVERRSRRRVRHEVKAMMPMAVWWITSIDANQSQFVLEIAPDHRPQEPNLRYDNILSSTWCVLCYKKSRDFTTRNRRIGCTRTGNAEIGYRPEPSVGLLRG
jgi:hypothetical protein